jgi:hypothetical protein
VKKIKMIILGTILLAFALPKVVKRIKNGLIRQNEELRRELSEKQAKTDRFTEVVRAYDGRHPFGGDFERPTACRGKRQVVESG